MAESIKFAVRFRVNSLLILVTILTYSIQIINLTTVAANLSTLQLDSQQQPALNSNLSAVLEGSKCNLCIVVIFVNSPSCFNAKEREII